MKNLKTEIKEENKPDVNQNDSSKEEIRMVEEKGMVGQPMGNKIQNTNYKNITPEEKGEYQESAENYTKLIKEKQTKSKS